MSLILPGVFFVAAIGFTLYPILPGAIFAAVGIIIYAITEGWSVFPVWFWIVQILLVIMNLLTDWLANLLGIKRAGGSKQAIWGSAIGMFIAPFLMGPIGIIIGPVVGAMAGELLHVRATGHIAKIGFISFIGFLVGTVVKLLLVTIQIVIFWLLV